MADKRNQELEKKLRELIIENPTSPIRFFIGKKAYKDELDRNESYIQNVKIKTIGFYVDEYYDTEEFDGRVYERLEFECEDKNEIEKKLQKIIKNTDFIKTICVSING